MLDPTGKPTPRLRARVLREELEGRLERLQELERWLREPENPDPHPQSATYHYTPGTSRQVRADAVAAAIEHVQQAMDALKVASKD